MKIQNKMFLMLFSFSLLLVSSLIGLFQWSIGNGLVDYVHKKEIQAIAPLVNLLSKEYQRKNSWETIQGQQQKYRRLIFKVLIQNRINQIQRNEALGSDQFNDWQRPINSERNSIDFESRLDDKFALPTSPPFRGLLKKISNSFALLDTQKISVVGRIQPNFNYSYMPIMVDNSIVGYLAISKRDHLTNGYELDLFEQQQSTLWVIGFVCMFLVAIISLPMAQHLVKPIKKINQGMHRLTQHDYDQRIQLNRKDEIGQLANDYNLLANTLAENDQDRKKWLANISHELRTPVAILRGELEAMIDKVRPLNVANIHSAHDEVKHLQCLIDDLYQLTSAGIGTIKYVKKRLHLPNLLLGEMTKYQKFLADANISYKINIVNEKVYIGADRTRLCQLFENLINNCMKYAKAKQLNVTLKSAQHNGKKSALLTIEDDGIGVDDVHLPHLFEHLYRADNSRNRNTGGTGLGLSICRDIVMAHEGDIWAAKSSLGGLAIYIAIPIMT